MTLLTARSAVAMRPLVRARSLAVASPSSSQLLTRRTLAATPHRLVSASRRACTSNSNAAQASASTSTSLEARPAFGAPHVASSVFAPLDTFEERHIGPRASDVPEMLQTVGYKTLDEFIADAVPPHIRLEESSVDPQVIRPLAESELLRRGEEIASMNQVYKSLIGMGYHNTLVPQVILRNVLENPAWYTSYTPYQPEISQGRLESLINFQTMVKSLTALDIANASLLDEGTAAAEAMILAYGQARSKRKTFLVDRSVLPQTIAVLRQRAKGFGISVVVSDLRTQGLPAEDDVKRDDIIGALVQYPDVDGRLHDWAPLAKDVKEAGGLVVAATDLLALTMIKPPGEWGADIALGNSARFGVPPGYGGPHAAFFAVSDKLKRKIPGRLVGLSKDQQGNAAYRLALQTREQHIRREKATSNICTAQALLANMSAMYAVYHGPQGLRRIAAKVHALTCVVKHEVEKLGLRVINKDGAFFDTLTIDLAKAGIGAVRVHTEAANARINLRRISDTRVGITLDETVTIEDLTNLLNVFSRIVKDGADSYKADDLVRIGNELSLDSSSLDALRIASDSFDRTSSYLTQPVFSSHRSETQMLRYIHSLQAKDLSLVHAMIPLGSCTMKLNATSSMALLSKAEYGALHPFAPEEQARGYDVLIRELSKDLCTITGFPAVSLQPNSGAQGEFAGLSVIRAYLDAKGQKKRDVCLIPGSAHGTNPASAIMAGMRVVAIKNQQDGTLDLDDLREKAEKHSENLAAFMVTYPSTYGVFESGIQDACEIIHKHGGQVYMDGANLQAQVGLTNPAIIGADVTHLNLHKTFSIPHGGGGPGIGPICCAEHLAPYLPGHPLASTGGEQAIDPISAAPFGSASILTISWAYIKQLGWSGLRQSSAVALLAANYMAARLAPHYKLRYKNERNLVAHEFLLDLAPFSDHVSVSDVAKRLSDYGFHAPTCSWPISTGLLVEPTESESREEMDRFVEAMISIRHEIQDIVDGKSHAKDNVLKRAPHTAAVVSSDDWDRSYARSLAAYPVEGLRRNKFWPAAGRLDDVHGDQNLVCECGDVAQYAEQEEGSATKRP
ncbi:putative GCV2-glycine decarboxylase P subunit [Jaminaea rosea]|uniref:Glycine cleavage system P protein n=1 Tax=Jaminaea rosea TaxID=1569628 RepID=A0A316V104_9BASI|nr:putative GCV2-glycine decarboxylase P subunit [Jaminaea rosea]PWN29125.1 putative GCV2-glycine decarboxylase P subunit [Jaminaea rosea]